MLIGLFRHSTKKCNFYVKIPTIQRHVYIGIIVSNLPSLPVSSATTKEHRKKMLLQSRKKKTTRHVQALAIYLDSLFYFIVTVN